MNNNQLRDYESQVSNYLDLQNKELQAEKLRRMQYENEIGEISAYQSREETNLIKYQLELTDELETIYHLLCGQYLGFDEQGNETWKDPEDDRLKIFSDYGVKRIMNLLSMYVNKNNLLAYYDSETITWKVRDFAIELVDLFNNAYELIFYYPSPEDLYEKYIKVVKENNLIIYEDELYQKCLQWSDEELQQKIINIPIMGLAIIDLVHATYQRALGGQERKSLRERINISQQSNSLNQIPQLQSTQTKMNLLRPRTW